MREEKTRAVYYSVDEIKELIIKDLEKNNKDININNVKTSLVYVTHDDANYTRLPNDIKLSEIKVDIKS